MCFDWRSGFGAATGSVIISVRQLGADTMQQMPWLTRFARWDLICGASCMLALTLMYRPGYINILPNCVRLCLRRFTLSLWTLSRSLYDQLNIRLIQPLTILPRRLADRLIRLFPDNVRRNTRLYGGFLSTYSLIIFQAINLYRWRIQGIESAASLAHTGYISTIVLDIVFFEPSRRCELGARDYLVRTFLSMMNLPGMVISFYPDMWERIYYLFITSSLTVLSMRNIDMQDPDERPFNVLPPSVRPTIVHNQENIGIPNGVPHRVARPPRVPHGENIRILNGVPPRPIRRPVVAAPENRDLENNENSVDEGDERN